MRYYDRNHIVTPSPRATALLNARIRNRGLSAREMWYQRDQFTNEQLPIHDRSLIMDQHKNRCINHRYSAASKAAGSHSHSLSNQHIQESDLVYLISDKDKSRARARYLVVEIDGEWCRVKKFVGSQLRAASYKIRVSDCYKVPTDMLTSPFIHREEEE